MLTFSVRKFCVGIFLFSHMAVSHAQEPGTLWRLRVLDLKHQLKVEATLRFTGTTATESCMGGNWKRVVVESKTAHEEAFFPLGEPLAFELERGVLTLGRTKVCDGYLFLVGRSGSTKIQGEYNEVGMGYRKTIGSFSLKKVR